MDLKNITFEKRFTFQDIMSTRFRNMWVRAINSMVYFRNPWNKVRIKEACKHWDACLDAQDEAMKKH